MGNPARESEAGLAASRIGCAYARDIVPDDAIFCRSHGHIVHEEPDTFDMQEADRPAGRLQDAAGVYLDIVDFQPERRSHPLTAVLRSGPFPLTRLANYFRVDSIE